MKNPMSRSRYEPSGPPGGPADRSEDRFGGIPRLPHDEDERPSREDRAFGETIFNRTLVPLPGFLRRNKRKARD